MQKVKIAFINLSLIAATALTLLAFAGSLIVINSDAKRLIDKSGIFHFSTITFVMVCIGTFFLWLFFNKLFKVINNADDKTVKKLTLLLFAIFIIISLVIIVNFKAIPMTDSFSVIDQSLSIAEGNESEIDTSDYFGRYKNNNTLVLFLLLFFKGLKLFKITDVVLASIILNFLMIFISKILFYLSIKKLMGSKFALKYLLLSIFHPIMYVTIPWVYTISLCMPFMAAVFYLGISIYKESNFLKIAIYSLLFGICSIVGFYMRPVVLILTIGFVVCGVLWLSKDKQKLKKALVGTLCFVIALLITKGLMDYAISRYYKDDSKSWPITHWIMMGLHGRGAINSEDQRFTSQFKTKEQKTQAHINEIKKTLKEYSIKDLTRLFGIKNVLTWSEGSGNYDLRITHNKEYTPLYRYLVSPKSEGFMLYCQIFRAFLYLFSLVAIIKMLFSRRKNLILFLPIITALGAMVFYLLWEAKQSYSIPFLFLFVILATFGLQDFNLVLNYKKINFNNLISIGAILAIAVTISIMIIRFEEFALVKREFKDISASCNIQANSTWVVDTIKSNKTVTQQFYTHKPFNTLKLKCKELEGDASYQVELLNGSNLIGSFNATKDDIKDSYIKFIIANKYSVTSNQYTIKIRGQGKKDSIGWNYHHTKSLDLIKGDFKMNDIKKSGDLHFIAYNEHFSSYTTPLCYILICFFILAVQIYLSLPLIKSSKKSLLKM